MTKIQFEKYYTLGELEDLGLIKLGRGKVISRNDIRDNPGNYPIYSSSALNNGKMGSYNKYLFDKEQITWSIDGGGMFFYREKHKYSITNVSGWLDVIDQNSLNIKFLYYSLINAWSFKVYDYTNKAHPSVIRNDYNIFIPNIEVQNKLARILDKFTVLEAELEAELEARIKQFEYYKNMLLIKNYESKKHILLKDIAYYSNTRISASEISGESYVGVDNLLQNKEGKRDSVYVPDIGNFTHYTNGDVLIGNIRPYLRKIWFSTNSGGTSGDVLVIRNKNKEEDKILSKYLYYLLSTESFFIYMDRTSKGAKMPRGSKNIIMNYSLHIPSIDEQKYIVEILDKFTSLAFDISVGLPKEIEMRKQQYEYYRNKLLTFESEV